MESSNDNPVFVRGLATRRAVMGDAHVDAAMSQANDFNAEIQTLAIEWAWGNVWQRDGLDRRTRSLATLAFLVALNRPRELAGHVRGALANGVTVLEIRELLLHSAAYCGLPAAIDAFRVATEELERAGVLPSRPGDE